MRTTRRALVPLLALALAAKVSAAENPPKQSAPPAKSAPAKPAPSPAKPAPDKAPAKPAAAAPRNIGGPGDFGLRERLVKRITADVELQKVPLSIVMVNGGVIFSGSVPNWTQRRRALTMAGTMRGVVNVTDQMEIPRGSITDEALGSAITKLLDGYKERYGLGQLGVQVQEGVLTLTGTTKDFASRVHAEESVGEILGLIRIVNRLRPENAPSGTDDATIRRALAGYLKDYREYPYNGRIELKVKDAKVTLSGNVAMFLARQQAGTMAALVGGVKAVDNQIEVDPSLQMQIASIIEIP